MYRYIDYIEIEDKPTSGEGEKRRNRQRGYGAFYRDKSKARVSAGVRTSVRIWGNSERMFRYFQGSGQAGAHSRPKNFLVARIFPDPFPTKSSV